MRFENFDDLIFYYKNCYNTIAEFHDITSFWTFRLLNKTVKKRLKSDLRKLKRFERQKDFVLMQKFLKNKNLGLISFSVAAKQISRNEDEIVKQLNKKEPEKQPNAKELKAKQKEENEKVKKVVKKIKEPERADFDVKRNVQSENE